MASGWHRHGMARNVVAGFSIVVLGLLLFSGKPRAETGEEAAQFVRALGDRAVAMLADETISAQARSDGFRTLLTDGFDVDRIARFVLGRYWAQADEGQQREFRRLFEAYIVTTYARRLNNYSGESLEVGTARSAGERDALVASRILRPGGSPIELHWRLTRDRDGAWRVLDVIVEGVSMAITQRSEFGAVIQGRGLDGLLQLLREKTAAGTLVAAVSNRTS